jgi:hypothetical protein
MLIWRPYRGRKVDFRPWLLHVGQTDSRYESRSSTKSKQTGYILKEAQAGMQWDPVTSTDADVDGHVNMSLKC